MVVYQYAQYLSIFLILTLYFPKIPPMTQKSSYCVIGGILPPWLKTTTLFPDVWGLNFWAQGFIGIVRHFSESEVRYKQNPWPWVKQLAWLLDGATASISLLLDSDTDRHGFDQHTDEELRKIVEEAARAAQAVTEGAKLVVVVVVVGTAARQRRLLPGCRCQSTQASYSSTAEDAILTSEAFPGCKFAKSVINPLS